MDECQRTLLAGLESLHLSLSKEQIAQLLYFIELIDKWNKVFNLTAIRDKKDMVRLHLLDSLAVHPFIDAERIIDIGTGAGLPGIPLAVCFPGKNFTLLDSNAKKTRFVQQAVLELKLKNVTAAHSRVEDYQPEQPFNIAITRAFASLVDIVQLTEHLLRKDGVLLAMKGQIPEEELTEISTEKSIISLKVPGVEAERCLIRVVPAKSNEENKLLALD